MVSRYVLPRYAPTIPVHISWVPAKNTTIQIMEGHPFVGSPKSSVLIITNIIRINAIAVTIKPRLMTNERGAVENPRIASNEYRSSPKNDHYVSPATLSTFSNSIHLVLNPTQLYIPLVNRLLSPSSSMASTIFRVIIR